MRKLPAAEHGNIRTLYFNFAQVHHGPTELVRRRHCHDLIFHLVEINIHLWLQFPEDAFFAVQRIREPCIVLCGVFRRQVFITDLSVIEIIKAWHSKNPFIESAKMELLLHRKAAS